MDWFLYDGGPRHERVKQHLSNIWSSVHEKVNKQHWGELKKSVAYKTSAAAVDPRHLKVELAD